MAANPEFAPLVIADGSDVRVVAEVVEVFRG
jgi:hypothetical protein